jgi:ferredoxin
MDATTAQKVVEEKIKIAPAEIAKKKQYAYYLDKQPTGDLVSRFLEAFAAILEHSNYRFAIDMMSKVSTHCGRCASACPGRSGTSPATARGFCSTSIAAISP